MTSVAKARLRRPLLFTALFVVLVAMLVTACAQGGPSTGGSAGTPAPTPVNIADVSLGPASAGSATPDAVPSAETLPSAEVPTGEPPEFVPPSEYALGADDLDAFSAAYEELFPGSGLDASGFDAVGTHLCTYLLRHADDDGVVDLEAALIEADMNEPGYTRGDWLAALGSANAHYCGEFRVDFSSAGG